MSKRAVWQTAQDVGSHPFDFITNPEALELLLPNNTTGGRTIDHAPQNWSHTARWWVPCSFTGHRILQVPVAFARIQCYEMIPFVNSSNNVQAGQSHTLACSRCRGIAMAQLHGAPFRYLRLQTVFFNSPKDYPSTMRLNLDRPHKVIHLFCNNLQTLSRRNNDKQLNPSWRCPNLDD